MESAEKTVPVLTVLLNHMLRLRIVPDSLKLGILTPVFTKKGSNLDSKYYRGITVNPTITKVLETIIRERIKPLIQEQQNGLQRGFTEGSSSMNCSLILEESIRNNKDSKDSMHLAFLGSKSAFDVVSHASLMRKLFHIGVEGNHWNLINSLHTDAQTVVKWNSRLSDSFMVQQGVRQGGILSTDLYKVYGNKLLDRLVASLLGTWIGDMCCVAPACADDLALSSDSPSTLQRLVNIGVDFSIMEKFLLQPKKSVIFSHLCSMNKKLGMTNDERTIHDESMPVVKEAMHMGMLRSHCTEESAVTENIKNTFLDVKFLFVNRYSKFLRQILG